MCTCKTIPNNINTQKSVNHTDSSLTVIDVECNGKTYTNQSSRYTLSQIMSIIVLSYDINICKYIDELDFYNTCQLFFKYKKIYVKYKLNYYYSIEFKYNETFKAKILERISDPHKQIILSPRFVLTNSIRYCISALGNVSSLVLGNVKLCKFTNKNMNNEIDTNLESIFNKIMYDEKIKILKKIYNTHKQQILYHIYNDCTLADVNKLDFRYNKRNKKIYKHIPKKTYKHIPKKTYKHIPKKTYKR